MKKRIFSTIMCLVIVVSLMCSFSVTASAALSGTVTGVMQDTAIPGSGKLYWTYKYNKLTGVSTLDIKGNGYMPDGTGQDWFQAQNDANCYIYEVTIGEGVKSIMSGAFAGEIKLEKIKLPSTIERIGEGAFSYTAIKEFNIPAKVKHIDGSMFAGSPIEKFTVNSANPYYKVHGGHVYSKDLKTFVAAASGKFNDETYKISFPKSVTEIGKFAFYNCKMKEFVVPYHVKSIKNSAFDGCSSLNKLTIQNGVEAIYDNAFYDCASLRNVQLPSSVTYLGYYSLGYNKTIAYDGIAQLLDEQGYKHPTINYSNYEYYAELAGYSGSMFVYPSTDISFSLYAPEGSVSQKYARSSAMNYYESSEITSVSSTFDGVTIKWNDTENAEYYVVYRKQPGGSWSTIYTSSIYDNSVNTYIDKPEKNSEYIYTIKVKYKSGYSYCDSNGKSVDYVKAPQFKEIKNTVDGISVKWDVSDGVDYQYVYRKADDAASWTRIAKVGGKVTSYIDTNVKPTVKYSYTVRANDGGVFSSYDKDGISVYRVEHPKFTVSNSATGVTIKWSKINYAQGYRVYRKTTGGWTLIGTVGSDKSSFVDTKAKSGTTYKYTVLSVYNNNYSGYVSSGTKIKALALPELKSIDNKVNGVNVTWSKVSGASGYYVYRKAPGGSWSKIANIKSGSTVYYLDKNVKNKGNYVYTVKAYSGSDASAHETNGIAIKFVSAPKVSSAKSSKSGITIKYNAISGADSYRIYRKTGNGSWEVLATTSKGTTTYVDKTAKKGQTYSYTVRAYSGSYRSGYYSNTIKVKDIY